MKKICAAVIIFYVMIFSANCSAGNVQALKDRGMIGNWYDTNGNLTLTIGSDYTINGCKILNCEVYGLTDCTAGIRYDLKIIEKNGVRDLILEYVSSSTAKKFSEENYHEMIIIDTKNFYYREKNQRHYESVGGIYLGMKKDEVLKLYGEPSAVEKNPNGYNRYEFKYKNDGFDVEFVGDRVFSVKIYDYGNRKFDRSGLSARDSYESYKKFYKPKADVGIRGSVFYIGNGELIFPPSRHNNFAILTVDQN